MAELAPGTEFAGHRIEGVAGRGGMSVVYRAMQVALGRRVALKVIARELAESDDFRERFQHESRIAASLDHPNVIPIYDAGDEAGLLWISMRHVGGTDLRALSAGSPLEPHRAVRIVADVAGALDAAHARGLVHRDVKPGNVLIEEGAHGDDVYLTDFGLSKRISGDPGLTKTGNWVGTAHFAAPEQIRGGPADARSDVYALGGVLFQTLTGRPPFPREDDLAKMYAHLHDPPPSLADAAPGLPRALDAVVARAMAKDPEQRFQTAGELGRAALAAVEEEQTVPFNPIPAARSTPIRDPAVRRRAIAVGALLAGVIALLAALGAFSGGGGSGRSSSRASTKAKPAATVTPTGPEITRLLQTYADRFHRRDAAAIGALFAADAVRRDNARAPMSRAKAVSSYRTQFARLRNPRYVLSGLKVKPGPDTATISGRYAITDGGSSKGGGSVIFHLAKLGGRVVIQELDLTRG